MNAIRFLLGLLLLAALPAAVQAQDASLLHFQGAWIREAPPGSPVRAGYVRIENAGNSELFVESVRSDAFGAIEMHEMREVGGVMRMRPLPKLRIEPGETLELKPGGLHLMMFRPSRELGIGERAQLQFSLSDGSERDVAFVVRASP